MLIRPENQNTSTEMVFGDMSKANQIILDVLNFEEAANTDRTLRKTHSD